MTIKSTVTPIDSGLIITTNFADDRNVTAHVANKYTALTDSASTLALYVNEAATVYQQEALKTPLRKQSIGMVRALGDAIKSDIAEARAIAENDLRAREVPKTVPRERFPEIRAHWRSLTLAQAAARANDIGLEELSALMDAGQGLSGLDDNVWGIVESRFLALAHIERSGLSADYQAASTPQNLIAIGVDRAAAEAAANAVLERHAQRKAALADGEASLRSVLDWLALMLDQSPDTVLAQALAR